MSRKAYTPTNVLARSSAPTGQFPGDLYFDTSSKTLQIYTGATWISVSSPAYGFADGGSPISVYGTIRPIDGGTPSTTVFSSSPVDGGGV